YEWNMLRAVLSQHAEEAAFLWLLRDDAARAPRYDLTDLATLDGRVEAHLDGLRIGGRAGWAVCQGALGQREPGEVFAAGVLALADSDPARRTKVLELGSSTLELSRALISALGWLPWS